MVSTVGSPSAASESSPDESSRSVSARSQTSSSLTEADCEKFRQEVHGFVLQLQKIIESVDESSVVGRQGSCDEGDGSTPAASEQPSLLHIVRTALHEISAFLETPFGRNASDLFNKYSSQLGLLSLAVNFTQVTTGVFVVNLFLGLANKLLQVKEDDFRLARKSIEMSLAFIREKLPEIKNGVRDAGEVFRKIREARGTDDKELGHHLCEFKEIIKTTKLNVKHCDEKLEYAGSQIEEAMRKIAVHVWLNGAVRGALMVAGAAGICYYRKTNAITTPTGVAIGVVGMVLLFVRIQPQYQKEKEDFLEYKITQDDLKMRLSFLSEHLKGHEDAFEEFRQAERK